MSAHGGNSDAEPNLVPLLDLVLQLVMFFMMCAHFVAEETDQTIKLPSAQRAIPVSEAGADVVHLGVDSNGNIRAAGQGKPLVTDDEIARVLNELKQTALQHQTEHKETGELKTLVIIRADKDASFDKIYRLMRRCQDMGLRKIQLRAEKVG